MPIKSRHYVHYSFRDIATCLVYRYTMSVTVFQQLK